MEERVGYQLKRAQQALRAAMDHELSGLGLTAPQYAALAALRDVPRASSAELARRCFVTPQTMHAIVLGLERRGLLARTAAPGRGRALAAELTGDGARLLERADATVRAIESRMTEAVSEPERRKLLDLLRRCAGALEAPAGG